MSDWPRLTHEAHARSVLARALMQQHGASAKGAVERELTAVAALVERSGAKVVTPLLCEWRAELTAVLGDKATCMTLLQETIETSEAIGAPLRSVRLREVLAAS